MERGQYRPARRNRSVNQNIRQGMWNAYRVILTMPGCVTVDVTGRVDPGVNASSSPSAQITNRSTTAVAFADLGDVVSELANIIRQRRLWDAGKRFPPNEWEPGKPCSIYLKRPCGDIFSSHRLEENLVHVPHITRKRAHRLA
jgi:hypothetical protein